MRGLILCAGLGERLRPLTATIAKPAIPFLNIPMLGYPLFWLEQLPLKDVVINTHYLSETVMAAAQGLVEWSYNLHFSHESPAILGSGGAIRKAADILYGDDEFITANGDAVFFFDRKPALRDMLDYHRRFQPLATLLVCPYPQVGQTVPGVWFDGENRVGQFGMGPAHGLRCLHYTGIMILSDRIFKMLPEGPSNILYDVLMPQILKGERVQVWIENMQWFETGRPADYHDASRTCLEMLFSNEGPRWHVIDVLDRFRPGWRNFIDHHVYGAEKPKFKVSVDDKAFVLLGKNIQARSPVHFSTSTIVPDNSILA